jgi:type IV pilus assembly protein PilV
MRSTFPGHIRGVTLLEVLIAILILSVGLLGSAGLQTIGLKSNVGASQRSAATLLAYEMADRMRANQVGVSGGYYKNTTATQQSACETAVGCLPQQMAQNDIYEWYQLIQTNLPNGVGYVCIDSSPMDGTGNASSTQQKCDGVGTTYAIKIWWLEDRSEANPNGALKLVSLAIQP